MLLQASGLSKSFGPRALFSGVHLRIEQGDRIGLVGPNGAGKTTLLRIFCDEIEADGGAVVMSRGVRIGYLAQEVDPMTGSTVLDAVLDGIPGWRRARDERDAILDRMSREPEFAAAPSTLDTLARADDRWHAVGADDILHRSQAVLGGLGFDPAAIAGPASVLSGGWLMRAQLARLLVAHPDVLLLDEPTNHLDFEALAWFEGFIEDYDGAVVAVSHDRYFLNRMPKSIAELGPSGITLYPGGYDDFIEGRSERRELLVKAKAKVDRERAHLERFVERFRAKATKAKQAQSRMKALAKLEHIEIPPESSGIRFRFPEPARSGHEVFSLERAHKAWGDNVVFPSLDLGIHRGDRIALVGPNGAGKSTLLKMLAGVTDIQGGTRRVGSNVRSDYFAQHQVAALRADKTVYEEAKAAATGETQAMIRSILGAFLFSGGDADKKVGVLSGGEKARLALAKMVLRAPNVLLLDEPTNHLDLTSREVLENALESFKGTIVVVSHDRYFINAVTNKILEILPGGWATPFIGDYDAYLYRKAGGDPDLLDALLRSDENAASQAVLTAAQPTPSRRDEARDEDLRKARKREEAERRNAFSRAAKPLKDKLAALEAQIARNEARLKEIEGRYATMHLAEAALTPAELRTLGEEESTLRAEVDTAMHKWEDYALRVEHLEEEFGTKDD